MVRLNVIECLYFVLQNKKETTALYFPCKNYSMSSLSLRSCGSNVCKPDYQT